jgi:peptidylprolyl isomerase
MSQTLRPRAASLLTALAASLALAACGANGEGAPAESGCPVGAAATACAGTPSSSASSSATPAVNPCASPTPAPAGSDDFCRKVAITNTLADGLQYGEITVGTGAVVKTGDSVKVMYTGWLQSTGAMFDTSRQPGRGPFPVTIGTTQVIKGWTEGLPGMRVGGKRRLVIPPDLGYGANGNPPVIPPNAVLVFDVEIVPGG